jgi:hypothetical protein
VFLGYDPREAIAFHVCANSIIRHASEPVQIIPLAQNMLSGFDGQRDGSNAFIYSRFLVPSLCDFGGHAIFMDGDMVVTTDIAELWNLRSHYYDVQVVHQPEYQTKQPVKYLGAPNANYPKKNWSSVILWNCGSFPNRILSPDFVSKAKGSYLHRFEWVQSKRLGELPREWNWIPQEFGPNDQAKIIHYSLGTPCFDEYKTTEMADAWHKEHREMSMPLSVENSTH